MGYIGWCFQCGGKVHSGECSTCSQCVGKLCGDCMNNFIEKMEHSNHTQEDCGAHYCNGCLDDGVDCGYCNLTIKIDECDKCDEYVMDCCCIKMEGEKLEKWKRWINTHDLEYIEQFITDLTRLKNNKEN